jgi:hypothetical protein
VARAGLYIEWDANFSTEEPANLDSMRPDSNASVRHEPGAQQAGLPFAMSARVGKVVEDCGTRASYNDGSRGNRHISIVLRASLDGSAHRFVSPRTTCRQTEPTFTTADGQRRDDRSGQLRAPVEARKAMEARCQSAADCDPDMNAHYF